jgi:hypothetical protein
VGALLVAPVPAAAMASEPALLVRQPAAVMASGNVEYVGTLPVEDPGVGAELVPVEGRLRFYVTGHKGISIYDVTDPARPELLGRLPFPHSQNEDVEVSADGSRLFIGADGSSLIPTEINGGTHVFDVSDPTAIRKLASHPDFNHTVECANAACDWIYGATGGIYRVDVTGPQPSIVRTGSLGFRAHAFNRDGAGYLVSDSDPRRVLDVSDPANPQVVATGSPAPQFTPDGVIQHNNVRPNADRWVPRDPGAPGADDPALRAGELLIGTSESNRTQSCANAGGLSTWSMRDFDRGRPLEQLHVVRPVRGTGDWQGGNPPGNVNGCSAHWFTYRDGLVAAAWFEHGTRFFAIDERTGEIAERGWYTPIWTSAAAAHWIPGSDYVYVVDYARGIDVLRFDRDAPAPTMQERTRSWAPRRASPAASAERYLCALAGGS